MRTFMPKYKYGEGTSWSAIHKKARKAWEDWWNQLVPKGYLVHHIDENPHNNTITNLALVTYAFHTNRHRTEETIEKIRQGHLGKKRIFSEEHRRNLSQEMKRRWSNPEYRKKMKKSLRRRFVNA